MKNENFHIRVTKDELEDIREVSRKIDIPLSSIAREALREKIAELRRTHPRLQENAQVVLNA